MAEIKAVQALPGPSCLPLVLLLSVLHIVSVHHNVSFILPCRGAGFSCPLKGEVVSDAVCVSDQTLRFESCLKPLIVFCLHTLLYQINHYIKQMFSVHKLNRVFS